MARSLHSRVGLWTSFGLCLWLVVPGWAELNRIVLRVNDRIATLDDYERRRDERVEALRRAEQMSPERKQAMLAQVGVLTFKEIYEELLILSRADQLDIRVSSQEIDSAVEQTKRNFNLRSEEELDAALASSGMTREGFIDQLRSNLMIQEVMGREVQSRIQLEEEDLRRYYRGHEGDYTTPQRVRVREVVILGDPREPELAERALAVRQALLEAEDPAAAVKSWSEAAQTSDLIDLSWVEAGDLEESLDEAVWKLESGELSEPIPARGGLHLLQVVEKQEARLREFAEVQQEIAGRLRSQRFGDELQRFLDELETRSYIVADPPPEAVEFLSERRLPQQDPLDLLISGPLAAAEAASGEEPEEPEEPDAGRSEGEVEGAEQKAPEAAEEDAEPPR